MAKRTSTGVLLGNIMEHYDTALYTFLSPLFAERFFPSNDPLSSLIMAYAIIPMGMLIRPVSALYFGYRGDMKGTKNSLIFSLFGMATATLIMGFLPDYDQIGTAAPLMLIACRLSQNFFAEGEKIGGAIFLIEEAKEEKNKDLASSFYGASTVIGILIAAGLISFLSWIELLEYGWRSLYWIGFLTAVVGIKLRKNLVDHSPLPLRTSLKLRLQQFVALRRATLPIVVATGFSYSCYSVIFSLMIVFVPIVTSVTQNEMLQYNSILLVINFCSLPLFGWLAHRISRVRLIAGAAFTAAVVAIPLIMLLPGASLATVLTIQILLMMVGVAFSAAIHSWSIELIPSRERYSTLTFASALGTQLFGGPTTVISIWIYQLTGDVGSIGWYWTFLAAATGLLVTSTKALPAAKLKESY